MRLHIPKTVPLKAWIITACAVSLFGCDSAPDDTIYADRDPAILQVGGPLRTPPVPEGLEAAGASVIEREAAGWVNYHRATAGLQAVDCAPALTLAASGHAAYITANQMLYASGVSFHDEVADHPGFIGEKYWERVLNMAFDGGVIGEVISFQPVPAAAIGQWMESVYHRLPILDPEASAIGYGAASVGASFFSVMEIGGYEEGTTPWPVAYPPDGAHGVPTAWDGNELPRPPEPPGGFPSGPVFTLAFPGERVLKLHSHSLETEDGTPVAHVALEPQNDPHLDGKPVAAIYAHAPLAPGAAYRVHLVGQIGDQPFTWNSLFTTATPSACSPLSNSCPSGKACYATGGAPVCAWMGTSPNGGNCTFQNDCTPGTTCIEGICRRVCDAGSTHTPLACARVCGAGHSLVAGADDLGACAPPACSPIADTCGSSEACYPGAPNRCAPTGPAVSGEPCSAQNACQAGLACVLAQDVATATCAALCDVRTGAPPDAHPSELSSCQEACPASAYSILGHPDLGVCLAATPAISAP